MSQRYPISAEDAFNYCKSGDLKTFDTLLIPAAFEELESSTGRKYSREICVDEFKEWPAEKCLYLRSSPVCEIQKMEIYDGNTWSEINLRDFEWSDLATNPKVCRKCNPCCSTSSCETACPPKYRVKYLAGKTPCSMPARAKILMLMLICGMNANRTSDTELNIKESPVFSRLIKSLKKPTVIT